MGTICPICANKKRTDLYLEENRNLKELNKPIQKQENAFVIEIESR